MLRLLRLPLLFPLLLVTLLVSATTLSAQSKDERAVRELIERLLQANNSVEEQIAKQALAEHASAAGPFYPVFTPTLASVVEVDAALSEFLTTLASRRFTPTSSVAVRVDRNTAWASFTWRAEFTFKDGTERAFDGRATLVFTKERRRWKFVHWHTSLTALQPPTASALAAEQSKILAVERAVWDAIQNNQPAALADYFADDISYFDEGQAYRVRGKQDLLRWLEALLAHWELHSWQILDPQVEVLGDTAILTYYFTEQGVEAGAGVSNAGKLSVVFVKQEGGWRALHVHRSVNPVVRVSGESGSGR